MKKPELVNRKCKGLIKFQKITLTESDKEFLRRQEHKERKAN